jgi:O-antigen/teichoic acid export membrane protein
MGAATTKFGAERYADGDSAGEAKVVWSGLCIALATTLPAALALAVCARPILEALHVQGSALATGAWALRVAGITFVILQLVSVVNTAQQVRLRWKQWTVVYTLSNVVGAVGVPVAIYLFSGSVVTATAVGLVASLVFLAGLSWDAVRIQPALWRPRVDRATVRRLLSYGAALAVWGVCAPALMTGERFFLSANTSTTVLAYYAVAMTVATTLEVLPEQLLLPVMPALARLEAAGSYDEHRELYQKTLSGLYLVLTPLVIVVALVAKPFLSLWAGPAYGVHGTTLLLVALGGVWASALAQVPSVYMLSAGKTKVLAALQVAELVPYLGAAWVLTAKWGAIGAAVVWTGRATLDSIAHFAVVRRLARLPVLPLSDCRLRSVAAPGLLGLACIGAASLTGGLLARVAIGALLLVAYGAAVWRLVLTVRERRGIANLLGEMFGPRLPLTRWRTAARTGRHHAP